MDEREENIHPEETQLELGGRDSDEVPRGQFRDSREVQPSTPLILANGY